MSRYFFQLYFTGISEQCGTLARNINGWRTGKDSSRKRITYCISHTSILICWYMLVKGNKKNPSSNRVAKSTRKCTYCQADGMMEKWPNFDYFLPLEFGPKIH